MKQTNEEVRERVRDRYALKATAVDSSCCGSSAQNGYSLDDLSSLPQGADLGLGCGNPVVAAAPRPGDVVLDLGSGAGIDSFLAARRVGPGGHVIGVDMTDEMLSRSREIAERDGVTNVEFRKGTIENLPVDDGSIDLIISNCVINLSPEKGRVFREAKRVLKPGGRFVVSDLVALRPATEEERANMDLYTACVSGAETREAIAAYMDDAGFDDVEIITAENTFNWENDGPAFPVVSAVIRGTKRAL